MTDFDEIAVENEDGERRFQFAAKGSRVHAGRVYIELEDRFDDVAVAHVTIDKAREVAEALIKVAREVELNAAQRRLRPGDRVTTEAQLDCLLGLSAVRTPSGNVAIKDGGHSWSVTGISRSYSSRELLAYGDLTILYNRSLENGGIE